MELEIVSSMLQNAKICKEKAHIDEALTRKTHNYQNTTEKLVKVSRELQQSKVDLIERENKHEEEKGQLQQDLIKGKQTSQDLLVTSGGLSWVSVIKKHLGMAPKMVTAREAAKSDPE